MTAKNIEPGMTVKSRQTQRLYAVSFVEHLPGYGTSGTRLGLLPFSGDNLITERIFHLPTEEVEIVR